jgi:branched-chain amino acid transport system ATP-binding protein
VTSLNQVAPETGTLQLRNVQVAYGDVVAVWDVSMSAKPGRITGLLGANGAGKTTLLSAIAGVLPVREGSILLEGVDILDLAAHRRCSEGIALVQEGKRIFRTLTVEENLRVSLVHRSDRRKPSEAFDSVYSLFPVLEHKRQERSGNLSGGQQQMLAIGQALIARPKVLMLDEPASGLAPIIADQLWEVVLKLRDRGLAVIYVEQELNAAFERNFDAVVLVEQGVSVLESEGPVDRDVVHKRLNSKDLLERRRTRSAKEPRIQWPWRFRGAST